MSAQSTKESRFDEEKIKFTIGQLPVILILVLADEHLMHILHEISRTSFLVFTLVQKF